MKEIADYLYRAELRGDVRYLLIGGRALEAHGYVRMTKDVDLLIAHSDTSGMSRLLEKAGFIQRGVSEICSRWQHNSLMQEDVDLMFVNPTTFEKLYSSALDWKLDNISIKVPSVANLIALKLHAIRNAPDRINKDGLDITTLMKLHPTALTPDEFKSLCLQYASEDVYNFFKALRL